jgi:hypothetical protein
MRRYKSVFALYSNGLSEIPGLILPAQKDWLTYEMFTADNFSPCQLFTFFIPNLFGGVARDVPVNLALSVIGAAG